MNAGDDTTFDLDDLFREIECYLEAVDLFRAVGCEPKWLCAAASA